MPPSVEATHQGESSSYEVKAACIQVNSSSEIISGQLKKRKDAERSGNTIA